MFPSIWIWFSKDITPTINHQSKARISANNNEHLCQFHRFTIAHRISYGPTTLMTGWLKQTATTQAHTFGIPLSFEEFICMTMSLSAKLPSCTFTVPLFPWLMMSTASAETSPCWFSRIVWNICCAVGLRVRTGSQTHIDGKAFMKLSSSMSDPGRSTSE